MFKIPKIIHQTYKDQNLPRDYRDCQQQIQKLPPDWSYRFWSDDAMREFIKKEYPGYYDAFYRLPRHIMRVDMFRYFLMYHFGGLYADLDYYMIRPFDLLDHHVVLPANREDPETKEPTCLGNCIFASEPGHPFWRVLMDTLHTIDRSRDIDPTVDSNVDGSVAGTGPKFVWDQWRKYTDNDSSIFVPRRMTFHPPTKRRASYIRDLEKSGSYGMHMCTGLWRNNKL